MGVRLVLGTFRREGGGKVLRLFIERLDVDPDGGSGVNLGLCAEVSREVGYALDASDVIDDAYRLEVSSPGIERPLICLEDFSRFAGRKAKIVTRAAVDESRRFKGILRGLEGEAVVVEISEDKRVLIPNEIIKKANLVFEDKV
jgi:ribosome maturation factor RimP